MFKAMTTDCIEKSPELAVEIARKSHVFFLCSHKLPESWTEAHHFDLLEYAVHRSDLPF